MSEESNRYSHSYSPRTFYAAQKGYKMSKYFDGRQKYDAVRR